MGRVDDEATQNALAAGSAAGRSLVHGNGINPRAMVGSLSETEWNYLSLAIVCGWIKSKSEHAIQEGLDVDDQLLSIGRDPEPAEIGAIETALKTLADIQGVDWSRPVGEWNKAMMANFAWHCSRIVNSALDLQRDTTPKVARYDIAEREMRAGLGGPLMTQEEMAMGSEIPF
jgi:hypothetical protein